MSPTSLWSAKLHCSRFRSQEIGPESKIPTPNRCAAHRCALQRLNTSKTQCESVIQEHGVGGVLCVFILGSALL
ncbi:MAG: hypothetical protein ACI8PT_002929 [Gammaproteobacteria bacterium]|jgi:hypothetical protein